MKKLLLVPVTIGLIAVPSLAMAQNGANSSTSTIHPTTTSSLTKPSILETNETETHSTSSANSTSTNNSTPVVVPDGSITADAAKAIAQALFPDKTIVKVETESENGKIIYEVKFSDGAEVKILASDGTVLSQETKKLNKAEEGFEHANSRGNVRNSNNSHHHGQDNDN